MSRCDCAVCRANRPTRHCDYCGELKPIVRLVPSLLGADQIVEGEHYVWLCSQCSEEQRATVRQFNALKAELEEKK